jgi:hypothetical protein
MSSDILKISRKLRPDQNFLEDFVDDNVRDIWKVSNGRGAELLKKDFGRPGWPSLRVSLRLNIEDL